MQSFKLAKNCCSFKIKGGGCEDGSCDCKKQFCQVKQKSIGFQDGLLRVTYVFCACLIVYSLLMLNGLVAMNPEVRSQNYIVEVFKTRPNNVKTAKISYLPNPKEVWMETVFFMDRVGGNMGNPLADTVQLYSLGLQKAFMSVGKTLALVPEILVAPAPYAMANHK